MQGPRGAQGTGRGTRSGGVSAVLVMAGGRSTRMGGGGSKLLAIVCGKPLLARVLEAAGSLGVPVYVAVSPHTPGEAVELAREKGARIVWTPGQGYSRDLAHAVENLPRPLLILPGDLPFPDPRGLSRFAGEALASPHSLVTLRACRGEGGDRECRPLGVSLYKGPGWDYTSHDIPWQKWLHDIDTPGDLEEADNYCRGQDSSPP